MPMYERDNSPCCCDFIVLQCARDTPSSLALVIYLNTKCLDFLVICTFCCVHLTVMSFIKISTEVCSVLQQLPLKFPQILQFLQ